MTVTVAVADYGLAGRLTETIPSGLAYVDGSFTSVGTATLSAGGTDIAQGVVAFNLLGASSISYQVTAGTTEDTYDINGEVRHSDGTESRCRRRFDRNGLVGDGP